MFESIKKTTIKNVDLITPVSNLDLITPVSRRGFLKASASLGVAAGLASMPVSAKTHEPDRRLKLINDHTWEELEITYWTHGIYIDESLNKINYLMRDHRANSATQMDPRLLDDLHRLTLQFDTSEPLHILSGYRTPATNAKLRARSKGVAKYSLHMEGKAADIYIPGIPTRTIQEAALDLKAGGVGYYSRSGFVHMDTGRVRHWER